MIYDFAIPVSANTTRNTAETTDLSLAPGTVQEVEILFPSGCAGLVHVTIRRGLHQVWPANADGSIIGDGDTVDWLEDYPMYDAPTTLQCVAWNEDDTYDHTISVRINLVGTAADPRGGGGGSLASRLFSALSGGR